MRYLIESAADVDNAVYGTSDTSDTNDINDTKDTSDTNDTDCTYSDHNTRREKVRGVSLMIPQAIRMAENAFRKYKTRDPFEIIEARNIKLKFFDEPKGLLGFYTVLNRKQIIGLNSSANDVQKRTGAIHELGHSLIDYRFAASGQRFDDFKFFSMSNAPSELNANLAGADLCIDDEYILETIHYNQYQAVVDHINQHISEYKTDSAKMAFEEEQIRSFYESYADIPSYDQLAIWLGVDVGVIKFKLRALQHKGYELPNLPETQADFLKNWR